MRVIGGSYGGRRLRAVEGHVTRPTSDRVREALFSRIEARYGLRGATVLDVFAGTGALAIEALSRGAYRAVCIELERRALDTLKTNLRELELTERVRVFGDDSRRVLAKLGGQAPQSSAPAGKTAVSAGGGAGPKRRFDGAFVDPPYGKGLAVEALDAIARFGLVRIGGWISVEVGRREVVPELVSGPTGVLERVREDIYGDTKLALYEVRSAALRSEQPGELPAEVQS